MLKHENILTPTIQTHTTQYFFFWLNCLLHIRLIASHTVPQRHLSAETPEQQYLLINNRYSQPHGIVIVFFEQYIILSQFLDCIHIPVIVWALATPGCVFGASPLPDFPVRMDCTRPSLGNTRTDSSWQKQSYTIQENSQISQQLMLALIIISALFN